MTDTLQTLRDFLRYAVSRFNEAELAYGHGTEGAVDEAAFIILEGLHLPVDEIEPYLDARLTGKERARLLGLIDERVASRKPVPYLLNRAYIQGLPFYVDERVIVPRSFIAEIIARDDDGEDAFNPLDTLDDVRSVLDLCTGSGCLAVLAALLFPDAEIDAVDLSADALAVARKNVADYGLEDRIAIHQGDLFSPLGGKTYDLILTNPPYVDAEAMAELLPEYRHEPEMALASGVDGLDIVRRILDEAPAHLNKGGGLLCEVGRGRPILDRDYPDLDFLWLETEGSSGEVFWLVQDDE